MLRIGVMGLGNIAQKAYLPVMATMQGDAQWVLCSRSPEKGQRIAAQYGFDAVVQTPDELIASGIQAVFLHTPTETHPVLIRQFLTAGVHVYVDKPVATDLAVVQELYAQAEAAGLLLTCGFNRRFAPVNVALKETVGKQLVVADKTRVAEHQPAVEALWDLAIHPIDTALWLADEPVTASCLRVLTDPAGDLAQAYYAADGEVSRVEVRVNMLAGVNLEQVTVQAGSGRQVTTDLKQRQLWTPAGMTVQARSDWEPMLETRGFAPLIRAFVHAVACHEENPVSPASAIASHAATNRLVTALTAK